jgi:hypothetical protein
MFGMKLRLGGRAMKGQIDCAFRVPFVAAPARALGLCARRLVLSQAGGERLRWGNLALSTFHESVESVIRFLVTGTAGRGESRSQADRTKADQACTMAFACIQCGGRRRSPDLRAEAPQDWMIQSPLCIGVSWMLGDVESLSEKLIFGSATSRHETSLSNVKCLIRWTLALFTQTISSQLPARGRDARRVERPHVLCMRKYRS